MSRILLCVSLVFAVSACGKKDDDKDKKKTDKTTAKKPADTKTKPADTKPKDPAPKAKKLTCESLGCTGAGTFRDKCNCKGKDVKVPLSAVATGGKGPFGRSAFDYKNSSDKDIEWASVRVYYYDKDGKQLETELRGRKFKMSSSNGSTMKIKASSTIKAGIGFKTDVVPKGTKTIQAVFDGWCYGDVRKRDDEFCVRVDKSPDDRPMAK